jgi:myo-inositol 2-dehydrogenase/D-chiro-inositol 1-dehydrogenase
VVDLVRDRKRPVQVGFMRRFDPGYAKAKAKIDAGELGKLETFRALSRDTYPPSLEYLLGSGGLFLDMSVHDLDLARFLVGEVEEVSAWASVLIDDKFAQADDADTAVTLLKFKNGVLGVIETSRRSNWGYDIRSSFDHYENFPDRFEEGYRLELEAFFSAFREGRPPTPGPEDALESLRLALAVTKSWREKRPVKVSEITQ